MYRVSVFVGKNLYIEYHTEDLGDACSMAEKMNGLSVYDSVSGHEIEPGKVRVIMVEKEKEEANA